jgi:putative membrane-bound dehydrogenase-like protein
MQRIRFPALLTIACLAFFARALSGVANETSEPIPHAQDKPPGPALSPEQAIARMTVPAGFTVELVASEPDIVNPVAMTFDERGRTWITESLEYPRREAGPGRDRVKVLEDTDGDGRADKFTIFADGLNIPSGIAVGHGGVWVANAPDLLFMQDTDGDCRADRQEVVVTGFGRHDTHELPNSLTWGPDGWLYGINGVFNPSRIEYRGRTHEFTCALFRIHPRTRDFEVFAEGTSNPWGVAWDAEGSAFFSACVIDHLWHIVETGYYHRQGGAYPPFTWKLGSIVQHKHQKAAYCGIHYFDSDVYPPEYRQRLYMGNIHGGCVNVDVLERDGSSYFARPADDFLTANDAWFMPVVQKTGPDGCLYVLDWYDRYHCYQDANRDPAGIDRLKGRLYRVRYADAPRRVGFDLAKADDEQLIGLLASGNVYDRDIAQRLLAERGGDGLQSRLAAVVLDESQPRHSRMHALWAAIGGGPLDPAFHAKLLAHADPSLRAWGVRTAGNMRQVDPAIASRVAALVRDPAPDVLLQVAIASRKIEGLDAVPLLADVLVAAGDDKVIPHIVWQNVQPLLEDNSERFLAEVRRTGADRAPGWRGMLSYAIERILARRSPDLSPIVTLYEMVSRGQSADEDAARLFLATLARQIQTGELNTHQRDELRQRIGPLLTPVLTGPAEGPLYLDASLLAVTWGDATGAAGVRAVLVDRNQPEPRRLQALDALVAVGDEGVLQVVGPMLIDPAPPSVAWPAAVLASLGQSSDAGVAEVVLTAYPDLAADLQPKAIELLTQRSAWARRLLTAIGEKRIGPEALNLNQVGKLLASDDEELVALVRGTWGTLRTERDPQREQFVAEMKSFIRANPGDPHAGAVVFKRVCGQCHKIYGEGQEVGPDITRNGRASFDQLLSNVFDPSLVIGASYQARTVVTTDGRVLTGLLVEDSEQRVVLKIQGGKLETIPREEIDEFEVSKLSMMPEGVEKQIKPDEMADLWAYLTLDRPPTDPAARLLPGVREIVPRESLDPADFAGILAEVAGGFTTDAAGEGGVALLADYNGRPTVVRTHPVNEKTPCVLRGQVTVPAGRRTELVLNVSHDPRGDWRLVVRANGEPLHDSIIGPKSTRDHWAEVRVDLTPLAGKTVELEIENRANNWAWEFGYWGRIEVISE